MRTRLRNIKLDEKIWEKFTIKFEKENNNDEEKKRFLDFTKGKSVILECCCGKGEFLKEEALKHPQKMFIGIDYAYPVLQRAVKRIFNEGLENVLFLYNAVEDVLPLFKNIELERIYVNFSDPWPKKRHWKRRVINEVFLKNILTVMGKNTELIVVTDHPGYAEWIEEHFENLKEYFIPIYDNWFVNELDEFAESDYMLKGFKKGYKINYFCVKKR